MRTDKWGTMSVRPTTSSKSLALTSSRLWAWGISEDCCTHCENQNFFNRLLIERHLRWFISISTSDVNISDPYLIRNCNIKSFAFFECVNDFVMNIFLKNLSIMCRPARLTAAQASSALSSQLQRVLAGNTTHPLIWMVARDRCMRYLQQCAC